MGNEQDILAAVDGTDTAADTFSAVNGHGCLLSVMDEGNHGIGLRFS